MFYQIADDSFAFPTQTNYYVFFVPMTVSNVFLLVASMYHHHETSLYDWRHLHLLAVISDTCFLDYDLSAMCTSPVTAPLSLIDGEEEEEIRQALSFGPKIKTTRFLCCILSSKWNSASL